MRVELMALGFLMSGPKTGYRLKTISGKMMMFYNITLNQICPALRKLEEAEYIHKEIVFQTGKPNKHVYSITDAGRDYFLGQITGPPESVDLKLPFLCRVFFFRFLDEESTIREFEKEIQALEEQLGDLAQTRSNVDDQADRYGRFIYRAATSILETMRDVYSEELKSLSKE